jgi:hypothetical protein
MPQTPAGSTELPWHLRISLRRLGAEATCGSGLPQVSAYGLSMRDKKHGGADGI